MGAFLILFLVGSFLWAFMKVSTDSGNEAERKYIKNFLNKQAVAAKGDAYKALVAASQAIERGEHVKVEYGSYIAPYILEATGKDAFQVKKGSELIGILMKTKDKWSAYGMPSQRLMGERSTPEEAAALLGS